MIKMCIGMFLDPINKPKESTFQEIKPRRFLRSGRLFNDFYTKSSQNSKYGSELGYVCEGKTYT